MTNVSFNLPAAALEKINEWADASGISRTRFHNSALVLGARTMTSSLGYGFFETLAPAERAYVSQAANTSVTPEVLLQIVLGGQAQTNTDEVEQMGAECVVELADDVYEQFEQAADSVGMARDRFYGLAFVTGARLVSSALDHGGIFPLELLVQSTEGDVTPEMLMQAMMGRSRQSKPKKPPDND